MNESINFIKQHCEFEHSKHDCYVLLAVSRKKDVPHITNSQEVVFREVLRKPEDLYRKFTRLKLNTENYRDEDGNKLPFYIYITVNARDGRKAAKAMIDKVTDCFYEEALGNDRSRIFKRLDREFISVLMKPTAKSKNTRYFMLDVDTKDADFISKVAGALPLSEHDLESTVVQKTKHGFHYKVRPFNIQEFQTKFTQTELRDLVEVKTDCLMFVEYISNSYAREDK